MTQIMLISVGTLKESYLTEAVNEYKKRLMPYARVEDVSIKEERIQNEKSSAEIERALAAEGKKILDTIPGGFYKIALCIEGQEYSSEKLAELIRSACDYPGKIAFIIGSSHGLSEEVKRSCDLKLSFSKMTFPHQLMRVMLTEAIYRSFTIIANKSYHK